MTVLRKDLPDMNKGAASLRDLIVGHQNKLGEQQNQADVDVGKATQMLPVEKQAEQDKTDIAVGGHAKQMQGDLDLANDTHDAYSKKGQKLNTKVGGVDISDAPVSLAGQQTHEMAALAKAAKASLGGPQQDLETAEMIHKLAENPSSVDMGTAQIMKARMAMGGNGGKALGAALRTMGMDDKTIGGDEQGFVNFIRGSAGSKQTPQQINALKEGAFKLGDDASERAARAKAQFTQQAGMYAPTIGMQAAPTFLAPVDDLASKHAARKAEYLKQAQGAPTGLSGGSAYKQPQGPFDKLQQLIMGGGQKAPAQAAPQQAAPAMSFEEFKKRKAAGKL